jgi:glycosyltransferase involved in cell wall biosynthesis
MTADHEYQALFLGAGAQMQCGVGQFTRLLCQAIEKLDPGSCTSLTLTRSEGSVCDLWRAIRSARCIVINFPIVAWKRVIFRPLIASAIGRLLRRQVVLIQHEWDSLHWLRRITYLPSVMLADTIIMFSPMVRRQLANDPIAGWTARKCVLAPLPPNIESPNEITDTSLRQQLKAARQAGRLVICHFGSIYPGKEPNALLEICAILRDRGLKPLTVYIGSFIKGFDKIEEEFHARANRLGLSEDIIVSGYIASGQEVFGLFSEIDAFCYPLEEGLTARRSSILTSVQSSRPVIVTGPDDPKEFDHHPRLKELIEHGAIVLVEPGSSGDIYADRIVASLRSPPARTPFDFTGWWRDVARSVQARLRA